MSQNQLQKFILQELNRYKREGVVLEDPFEQIKKWISPTTFLHFTNINKLGVNPQYHWSITPAGVYSYPLNESGYEALMNDDFSFGSDFKYLILFSITETNQIFDLSEDISDEDYAAKIDIVRQFPNFIFKNNDVSGYPNTNIKKLYIFVNSSTLTPFQKRKAFMACGINGFIDRGESFITNDIEAQAVFFNPKIISQQLVIKNPLLKTKLHDIVVGASQTLSNTGFGNTPQNVVDKLLADPYSNDRMKSYAISHASFQAINKFITPQIDSTFRRSALSAIGEKYPEKIILFFDSQDLKIRCDAYRYAKQSIVHKNLTHLLAKEKHIDGFIVLADRASQALAEKFLPYLEQFKHDSKFETLYFLLRHRDENGNKSGTFQTELEKYHKYI